MGPAKALLLRTFADARVRTLSFSAFVALYGLAQVIGYSRTFPTAAERLHFAQTLGNDTSLKLFYGMPHHVETVGGYTAWRVGGVTALIAAFFGILAAVRAFRTEEETGRFDLVASGAITRRAMYLARLGAVGLTIAILWLALLLGIVIGGLHAADTAYLALASAGVALVYAGVGLVAGEIVPTSAAALELSGLVFGCDLLLRAVADIGNHPALHWLGPLGWAEEVRPFATPRPAVLLHVGLAAALCLVAYALNSRRDIGTALLAPAETVARPRTWFLRSPLLLAARMRATSFAVWLAGTTLFAGVLGALAEGVSSTLTPEIRRQLTKLGAEQLTTAEGVLGFYFLFIVLIIAFFCCAELSALRGEESTGRIELLCALPLSRLRWFSEYLALIVAGACVLALAAGLAAAIGTTMAGTGVSYPHLIGAGLNCLPASMLFLGLGALLIAAVPRQGIGIAYGLVAAAFVWYLVGGLLKAPDWLVRLSPFAQIGFVPAQPFRATPAVAMPLIGVAASVLAVARFRVRDLVGN